MRSAHAITCASLVILAGCLAPSDDNRPSVLAAKIKPTPIQPGPQDILMNIVFVERAFGDRILNEDAWEGSDEQQLDLETRNKLESMGFRVAVQGGAISGGLDTLLRVENDEHNGQHYQLRSGTPTQLNISAPHELWPTTIKDDNTPTKYEDALSAISIVPTILADGSIDVAFTPQVLHGGPIRQYYEDKELGPLNWSTRVLNKRIRSLDDLVFSLRVQPGQRILLSCAADRRESLAAYFFGRREDGDSKQRLIIVDAEAPMAGY